MPFSFAVVTTILIWNIALVCKVKNQPVGSITKLSDKPYIVSLGFMICQMFECCVVLYMIKAGKIETGDIPYDDKLFFNFTD